MEPGDARERLLTLYASTRARTEALSARLSIEDQQLQSMEETSPTKWHRAHTTWLFETFVLAPEGVAPVDPTYGFLFNSYYEVLGPRQARGKRGLLSRPTAAQVTGYRRVVDERLTALIAGAGSATLARIAPVVALGVAHEEQHQELLLTDILHAFSQNPTQPAFAAGRAPGSGRPSALRYVGFEGGLHEIGAGEREAFAFDNERPRHHVWVEPFALADRLLTVGELKGFLDAGGYRDPLLWLSEGFEFVCANGLRSPLYTSFEDGALRAFGLTGARVPPDDEPIVHVSYYEADAIARFLGARLPTEAEWELAAAEQPVRGNFVDDESFQPLPASGGEVRQLFGDAWEWTASSYQPYPGFRPMAGSLAEYNGKFMVNQQVLRGGSCLSPRRHLRPSYRNFWPAQTRFQMAGVRLARSR